jgi:lipoprotein-releasing system permease protein
MYKLFLAWRYLRTRYIALASIVSVTLGVATMIVVNSVMHGFTHEMQDRIHNILSDVVFESSSLEGFYDAEWHMDEIRRVAGERIEGMTATVVVPAMLSFEVRGKFVTRPVQLIGIDEKTYSQVGDFGKFLQHPANRQRLRFDLRDGGYDVHDHQAGTEAPDRPQMGDAGWKHRRRRVEYQRPFQSQPERTAAAETPVDAAASAPGDASPRPQADIATTTERKDPFRPGPGLPTRSDRAAAQRPATEETTIAHDQTRQQDQATAPSQAGQEGATAITDPFADHPPEQVQFDPSQQQRTGVVLGIALASYRNQQGEDKFLLLPGDDV